MAIVSVLVVGFHHQLGPQVDFSYPSLPLKSPSSLSPHITNASPYLLPEEWKFLPFLALPDGIHNVNKDYVYFLLPPCDSWPTKSTVYGVSCYQQINAEELVEKSADVTRNRVQKAIVVLSSKPLFGVIKAKVEMVTEAYFHQRDFSKFDLLQSLYHSLHHSLSSAADYEALHIGTSPRFLVKKFGRKLLVIFKLLLLERRVIFYGNPASELSTILLSLLSLFPGLISKLEVAADPSCGEERDVLQSYSIVSDVNTSGHQVPQSPPQSQTKPEAQAQTQPEAPIQAQEQPLTQLSAPQPQNSEYAQSQRQLARAEMWATLGLPLRLFERGSVFLPYFSLLQLDQLAQAEARSYLIGCSNIVFLQQKKIRPEVFVDLTKGTVEYLDHSDFFEQLLYLTAADYEFISKIVEKVEATWEEGEHLSGNDELSSWEGSNGWIRQQFELYLAALVCTVGVQEIEGAVGGNSNSMEDFFVPWVTVWQRTQNYSLWKGATNRAKIASEFTPGHPFHVSGSFVELRSGIARRVEGLNTLATPIQTEISKAVTEGGKVLTGYLGNISGSIKSSGVTNALGTTVNSWWKIGSQYVNAAVEKARETLDESPVQNQPLNQNQSQPQDHQPQQQPQLRRDSGSSQATDEHFVFV